MSSPSEKHTVGNNNGGPVFPSNIPHLYKYPIPSTTKNPGLVSPRDPPEVKRHGSNSSNGSGSSGGNNFKHVLLSNESAKEKENEGKGRRKDELELLPGSGPGGVPQQYFNVSS